jgi:uncharacterized protein
MSEIKMGEENVFEEILEFLEELKEDNSLPRNVKLKIENLIEILSSDADYNISKDKALTELEDISNDNNLQSFIRTQIWSVISMLENIN